MVGGSTWHEQRQLAFAAHTADFTRQRSAATAQARQLVADFVREMVVRGIPPVRLRARVPDRRATYRTGLRGWYIRPDRSLAIGVDGGFYRLETRPSLWARVAGVRLAAVDPPLRVGVGARDGESALLAHLLTQRLAAG